MPPNAMNDAPPFLSNHHCKNKPSSQEQTIIARINHHRKNKSIARKSHRLGRYTMTPCSPIRYRMLPTSRFSKWLSNHLPTPLLNTSVGAFPLLSSPMLGRIAHFLLGVHVWILLGIGKSILISRRKYKNQSANHQFPLPPPAGPIREKRN